TQTTQNIGDIIIETNNDQGTFYEVDNTTAKHNRLYRERHREEVNQRKRYMWHKKKNSQQIHILSNIENIDEIEQIAHVTSNNQLSSNSQRQYYERNKEEKKRNPSSVSNLMLKSTPSMSGSS
ncbi:hypothetical protein PV325_011116, partial [Microctonus aethiopoides]